jgi:hypothetical protein
MTARREALRPAEGPQDMRRAPGCDSLPHPVRSVIERTCGKPGHTLISTILKDGNIWLHCPICDNGTTERRQP